MGFSLPVLELSWKCIWQSLTLAPPIDFVLYGSKKKKEDKSLVV